MTIGAKAGRVKPTTGYAFLRIQQDSAAIVHSLLAEGHPFAVPADARGYRLLDSIMLAVMAGHGEQIKPLFTAPWPQAATRSISPSPATWRALRIADLRFIANSVC